MAASITEIPEIAALEAREGIVRIPGEIDVPFTPRVRRLVDTPPFRRLAHVSQLGLVAWVYPGATHTRFEHALGVYYLSLRFLRQLCRDRRFCEIVTPHDAEVVIVAALLHDLGHWPFCHAIEDLNLDDVPRHEALAAHFLNAAGPLADVLCNDWDVHAQEVLPLIAALRSEVRQAGKSPPTESGSPKHALLRSLLSGPVDVDKMDYLQRDSLHAGVPYGRHFDQNRLIGSLMLNAPGDGLALHEKGKTAAELMVFARYVMFNEVYWHHTVRSATAMLARAFYELRGQFKMQPLFHETEEGMSLRLRAAAQNTPWSLLLEGIFGAQRSLYKRLGQFSSYEQPETYHALARRPYPWLVGCARELAAALSESLLEPVGHHELLIDAPPVQREVEFRVDIYFPKEKTYRPLGEVSPVIRTLAQQQFDDYVKRVRVFCHPRLVGRVPDGAALIERLTRAIARTDQHFATTGTVPSLLP